MEYLVAYFAIGLVAAIWLPWTLRVSPRLPYEMFAVFLLWPAVFFLWLAEAYAVFVVEFKDGRNSK